MSEALKGALIIGQSGGPSSVINSSAYGCIRTALDADCITRSSSLPPVLRARLLPL